MNFKLTIFIAVCILSLDTAKAQTCKSDYSAFSDWTITMDNDTFTRFLGVGFLNEDRNYTQGGEFSLNSPLIACLIRKQIEALGWYKKIENYNSLLSYQVATKIFLRYSAFTPDDLRQEDPIIGDRPYSSVVWGGMNYNWLDQQLYTKQSWELSIGVMGIPGLAEGIQSAIHEAQNDNNTKPPYNPEGWDNQVSQGGEPTAIFSYSKKHLLNKKSLENEASNNLEPTNSKIRFQGNRTFNLDVGHVTQAGFGLEFRLGVLDLRNWHLNPSRNTDAVTVNAGPYRTRLQYFKRDPVPEYYFYGDLRLSALLYNGSLHGQFRNSEYTLPWKDTGFIYASSRIGIMLKVKNVLFSPYVGLKSPEFWNKQSRIHAWAGFTFTRVFCNSRS